MLVDGMVLGGEKIGSVYDYRFDGEVKNFAVFDRALSPSEISNMADISGEVCATQLRGTIHSRARGDSCTLGFCLRA